MAARPMAAMPPSPPTAAPVAATMAAVVALETTAAMAAVTSFSAAWPPLLPALAEGVASTPTAALAMLPTTAPTQSVDLALKTAVSAPSAMA